MTDLNQIVTHLANARADRDVIAQHIEAARAEFEASIANIVLSKKAADQRVAALEDVARAEAITAFNANPDGGKHPHPALGIRESTKVNYQEDAALEWAIVHEMRTALKLDKNGFEKLVKAGAVTGILLAEEPIISATIATDLSAYVEEGA